MSIVTKTGDAGSTGLWSGERVQKSDPRIELLGELDELNSHIGVMRSFGADLHLENLQKIQETLFEVGAQVANPNAELDLSTSLHELEKEIMELESQIPPLSNFVLPGGHPAAAQAFLARAVCRRVERKIKKEDFIPYFNRLSDHLFLCARKINLATQTEEVLWKNSRKI